MAEPLMTPRDVAQRFRAGLSTIYRLAREGTLPAVQVPGTNLVRFRRERVEALILQWEKNGTGRRRVGLRPKPASSASAEAVSACGDKQP